MARTDSGYHNPHVVKRRSAARIEEIPEALKNIDRWMGTRFERRKDGKVDKPPHRVRAGQRVIKADKTDPENWATYAEAMAAYERGDVDTVGFVFTEGDPFFVVDLDGVIDRETGEILEAAAEIIHTMASYTELSCSGTGAHIIGEGQKPEWAGCKSKKMGPTVEVYDSKRFVVMTGKRIGEHREPLGREEQLEWLCQRLWIKAERMHTRPPSESRAHDLEDEALLDRARNARTGAKFTKLFDDGDISGHESASNADFALLNMLVFWTAGDPERIARLFEMSALYRSKSDGKHAGYVGLSVRNALASYKGAFYQPRDIKKARKEDPEDPITPYLKVLLDPSLWSSRKGASAYKTYTALVILAEENGVTDDNGDLRIGCDTRRIAEVAGTRQATVCQTALPHLIKMKLVRWRKGKGTNAGVLILPKNAPCIDRITKVATHFSDTVCARPSEALKILRLFIRNRAGHANTATLLRLGMPAMFCTIALTSACVRGYSLEELAEKTGRRKSALDWPESINPEGKKKRPPSPIKRLKAAGIIQESDGRYRLSKAFASRYEQVLEWSGVTYTERRQREQHEEDRRRRAQKISTDRQKRDLKGPEHNARILKRNRERERDRWIEEQRKKVGATVATFLADELKGVTAMNFHAMRLRFQERGGNARELWRAVHNGPWCFYREADGDLYVRPDETPPDDPSTRPTDEERIKGLIAQGMGPKWARAEVLSEEVF
jgi:putative DNA primase/helicase